MPLCLLLGKPLCFHIARKEKITHCPVAGRVYKFKSAFLKMLKWPNWVRLGWVVPWWYPIWNLRCRGPPNVM